MPIVLWKLRMKILHPWKWAWINTGHKYNMFNMLVKGRSIICFRLNIGFIGANYLLRHAVIGHFRKRDKWLLAMRIILFKWSVQKNKSITSVIGTYTWEFSQFFRGYHALVCITSSKFSDRSFNTCFLLRKWIWSLAVLLCNQLEEK